MVDPTIVNVEYWVCVGDDGEQGWGGTEAEAVESYAERAGGVEGQVRTACVRLAVPFAKTVLTATLPAAGAVTMEMAAA